MKCDYIKRMIILTSDNIMRLSSNTLTCDPIQTNTVLKISLKDANTIAKLIAASILKTVLK
jgi:hypothetical protein